MQRQNEGHLAPFPVWDDVCTFDGRPWRGIVDVVSGGFPCQAYSTATAGKSVARDFWPDMLRIVADVAPPFVFAENVSRAAIEAACDDLEALGYETRALALGAKDLGGDHERPRYWLRAYADDKGELRGPINAEMAVLPGVRARIWDADPGEHGMADGLAHRMDRYKSIGNGQLPIVAASAWNILSNTTA